MVPHGNSNVCQTLLNLFVVENTVFFVFGWHTLTFLSTLDADILASQKFHSDQFQS